jgi:hypothetical protein
MSAALQLPAIWGENAPAEKWHQESTPETLPVAPVQDAGSKEPKTSLAFYRRQTESLLRRYLCASMQVGRTPSLLGDPVSRGWASSRPIRCFEDAVIFVLDVEQCLSRLNSLDRQMLFRIVLQEYTHAEAAPMIGMSVRSISCKFTQALDRLTERLLETGLLVLPE